MKIQLLLGICRVAPQQIVVKRGGTCVFFVNTMSRPLSYAWARVDTSMANPGSPQKKKTCRYLAKPRIENMSWQCQKHVMAHHGTPKEQLQQPSFPAARPPALGTCTDGVLLVVSRETKSSVKNWSSSTPRRHGPCFRGAHGHHGPRKIWEETSKNNKKRNVDRNGGFDI